MQEIKISRYSPFSGALNVRTIVMNQEDYDNWAAGKYNYIQDAFPYLSADDREFIKTGITPEEWLAVCG
jgi:hypothetical protein